MSELPFVAEPPGDAAAATRAAEFAADRWGLQPPIWIRTGMNALFSAGGDVVLRVSRPTAPPEQAIWLAHALRRRGIRVPLPFRDHALTVDGLAVVAIERLTDEREPDWAAVGEMVALVHSWSAAEVIGNYPLPRCSSFPWWNASVLLAEVDDLLDEPARRGLVAALTEHGGWVDHVTTEAVCHGDVHPGNVLRGEDGPVLIDWDLLCLGPVAWDHAPLLTWAQRWGGAAEAYDDFAAGYGASLRADPLAESLAAMRNLVATLMRVKAGRTNDAAAREAESRLRFWRGDPDAPQWHAQ